MIPHQDLIALYLLMASITVWIIGSTWCHWCRSGTSLMLIKHLMGDGTWSTLDDHQSFDGINNSVDHGKSMWVMMYIYKLVFMLLWRSLWSSSSSYEDHFGRLHPPMKTTLVIFILLWRPLWSSSVCYEDHSGHLHPPMKITLVIFIMLWRPLWSSS